MDTGVGIEQLLDVGFSAVTLAMLYLVWKRLSNITDTIIGILLKLSVPDDTEALPPTTKP